MPKNLINIKEDIISVTRELLKKEGYSQLNIRNIAAKCGVATGTVYNYYRSKNEIIAEILINEWNLMLRRIDQKAKSIPTAIDKLEIIFEQLNFFMSNVHGIWIQTSSIENTENMNIAKINEKRKMLRNQIAEKVRNFSLSNPEKNVTKDELKICDVISHILISYSNECEDFNNLKPALNALVTQLESNKTKKES